MTNLFDRFKAFTDGAKKAAAMRPGFADEGHGFPLPDMSNADVLIDPSGTKYAQTPDGRWGRLDGKQIVLPAAPGSVKPMSLAAGQAAAEASSAPRHPTHSNPTVAHHARKRKQKVRVAPDAKRHTADAELAKGLTDVGADMSDWKAREGQRLAAGLSSPEGAVDYLKGGAQGVYNLGKRALDAPWHVAADIEEGVKKAADDPASVLRAIRSLVPDDVRNPFTEESRASDKWNEELMGRAARDVGHLGTAGARALAKTVSGAIEPIGTLQEEREKVRAVTGAGKAMAQGLGHSLTTFVTDSKKSVEDSPLDAAANLMLFGGAANKFVQKAIPDADPRAAAQAVREKAARVGQLAGENEALTSALAKREGAASRSISTRLKELTDRAEAAPRKALERRHDELVSWVEGNAERIEAAKQRRLGRLEKGIASAEGKIPAAQQKAQQKALKKAGLPEDADLETLETFDMSSLVRQAESKVAELRKEGAALKAETESVMAELQKVEGPPPPALVERATSLVKQNRIVGRKLDQALAKVESAKKTAAPVEKVLASGETAGAVKRIRTQVEKLRAEVEALQGGADSKGMKHLRDKEAALRKTLSDVPRGQMLPDDLLRKRTKKALDAPDTVKGIVSGHAWDPSHPALTSQQRKAIGKYRVAKDELRKWEERFGEEFRTGARESFDKALSEHAQAVRTNALSATVEGVIKSGVPVFGGWGSFLAPWEAMATTRRLLEGRTGFSAANKRWWTSGPTERSVAAVRALNREARTAQNRDQLAISHMLREIEPSKRPAVSEVAMMESPLFPLGGKPLAEFTPDGLQWSPEGKKRIGADPEFGRKMQPVLDAQNRHTGNLLRKWNSLEDEYVKLRLETDDLSKADPRKVEDFRTKVRERTLARDKGALETPYEYAVGGVSGLAYEVARVRLAKKILADKSLAMTEREWSRLPREAQGEYVKLPVSDTDFYGPLANHMLQADLALDLANMEAMQRAAANGAMRAFRRVKGHLTAYSPVTTSNNIWTNVFVFAPSVGMELSPRNMRYYAQAFDDLWGGGKSQAFERAYKADTLGGNFQRTELANVMQGVGAGGKANVSNILHQLTDLEEALVSTPGSKLTPGARKFARNILASGKALYDLPPLFYGAVDDWFRLAFHYKLQDQGAHALRGTIYRDVKHVDDVVAADLARKGFTDYEEIAGFGHVLRSPTSAQMGVPGARVGSPASVAGMPVTLGAFGVAGQPFISFTLQASERFKKYMEVSPLKAQMHLDLADYVTDLNRDDATSREDVEAMLDNLAPWERHRYAYQGRSKQTDPHTGEKAHEFVKTSPYSLGFDMFVRNPDDSTLDTVLDHAAGVPLAGDLLTIMRGKNPLNDRDFVADADPDRSDKVFQRAASRVLPAGIKQAHDYLSAGDDENPSNRFDRLGSPVLRSEQAARMMGRNEIRVTLPAEASQAARNRLGRMAALERTYRGKDGLGLTTGEVAKKSDEMSGGTSEELRNAFYATVLPELASEMKKLRDTLAALGPSSAYEIEGRNALTDIDEFLVNAGAKGVLPLRQYEFYTQAANTVRDVFKLRTQAETDRKLRHRKAGDVKVDAPKRLQDRFREFTDF